MRKLHCFILGINLVVLTSGIALAQLTSSRPGQVAPYYINLNLATTGTVYTFNDKVLNIEYHDNYGEWKEMPMRLYNWKNEQVGEAVLGKSYGANLFTVNLETLYTGWENDKIYTCRLRDESGKKYEVPFKIAVNKDAPEVNIVINPITLKCDELSSNVIEFYGDIRGGRAPFVVTWAVSNNEKSALIYQPKEEILEHSGRTSMITVDHAPEYFVLLQVKDACGLVEQRILRVACDENRKKVSTLTVEELQIEKSKH
jgi:hypothetical protein